MRENKSEFYAQVRIGRVSSVNKTRHTAQVKFEEIDGFVSFDLQVLVQRAGDYWLPQPNTPVVCLILDGRLGVGFVVGAIYTESDEAPLDNEGARAIASDDLRLGDPDADKAVCLDGDESDGGMILFTPNVPPGGAASIAYVPPPGPYPPPTPPVVQLHLKAKISATAEKVTAK